VPTVPFLEASKAMARGVGYAGEGDLLTAALVGALASAYPDTTFTEMFCPDWQGNSIFLSHMGEMNLRLVGGVPQLRLKPFPFTSAQAPVVAVGGFRGGQMVIVNLAPGPGERYALVVAPGEMLHLDGENKMADSVHGWFQPPMRLADFLAGYSRAGGTHHSALVYGASGDEIARWGEMMGWKVTLLK
jgi:L-arabinose isomerase